MSEPFYLTLHSDGDSHVECSNSSSSFTIHLGHLLELPGKWEVGVADIHYPLTMNSIQYVDGFMTVLTNYGPNDFRMLHALKLISEVKGSCHYTNDRLIRELATQLKPAGIETTLVNGHLMLYEPEMSYENIQLNFTEKLKRILGIDDLDAVYFTKSNNTIYAAKPVDVTRGLPHQLFVYTDIIKHQKIGATYDKLLRIVPVDMAQYRDGAMAGVSFTRIHYYPLCSEKFYSIKIDIKDRSNRPVSFQSGPSTVTLHFRRVNNV